jgi:hypothetical protein
VGLNALKTAIITGFKFSQWLNIDVWRKLHNEELRNSYSSPNIIRMIKSRRMRWAGHAARMGRGGMHIGYW